MPYKDPKTTYARHAMILSTVSGLLVFLALLINGLEKNLVICTPLCLVALVCLVSILLARYKNNGLTALILVSLALMSLGMYLLFFYDRGGQEKLFWFLLFPPMVMLCLGTRYGNILFFLFFFFLAAAFLGPFRPYLANSYPLSLSLRFLVAMFGAWVFSWLLERARQSTQIALQEALKRLEHEALTDPLTGLGNRRDFQAFFDWVQAKAVREQQPFCLVLIDIDHFKDVNDRHGHDVGDAVLRHTANLLGERIRAGGRLFRWGGEEFAALLLETSFAEARKAAERLRRSIEEHPYRDGELCVRYTISLGLYCGSLDEELARQVERADDLLYKAKHYGRNQVQSDCLYVKPAGAEADTPLPVGTELTQTPS